MKQTSLAILSLLAMLVVPVAVYDLFAPLNRTESIAIGVILYALGFFTGERIGRWYHG
jgi:hypothetical protein